MLDRRQQKTRRQLRQAFIDLVLEQGLDKTTIRDITERADVAYSTFFRHYNGKEQILIEQLDLVMQEFETKARSQDGDFFMLEGRMLFEHVQSYEAFYKKILNSRTSQYVTRAIRDGIALHLRESVSRILEQNGESLVPLDILLNHIGAATVELVVWWLEQKKPYSIEEMAALYDRLICQTTWYAALGREIP